MLKITKAYADRINIELNGALDADEMRRGLDDLIELSDGVSNGKICYTIKDFSMPTLGALGVEMSRLPKLFGLLAKFDRCAVLADEPWLRKTAEIEGALFPGIDIKGFALDQVGAAEVWLKFKET